MPKIYNHSAFKPKWIRLL